jgi:hypothetical protein
MIIRLAPRNSKKAYEQGYDSYKVGLKMTSNPFKKTHRLFSTWNSGWLVSKLHAGKHGKYS